MGIKNMEMLPSGNPLCAVKDLIVKPIETESGFERLIDLKQHYLFGSGITTQPHSEEPPSLISLPLRHCLHVVPGFAPFPPYSSFHFLCLNKKLQYQTLVLTTAMARRHAMLSMYNLVDVFS